MYGGTYYSHLWVTPPTAASPYHVISKHDLWLILSSLWVLVSWNLQVADRKLTAIKAVDNKNSLQNSFFVASGIYLLTELTVNQRLASKLVGKGATFKFPPKTLETEAWFHDVSSAGFHGRITRYSEVHGTCFLKVRGSQWINPDLDCQHLNPAAYWSDLIWSNRIANRILHI